MKKLRSLFLLTALLLALALTAWAQAPANGDLSAAINQELEKAFKPNEPGAAVIVTKDGQTLFRKGYGMANLELGVPNAPEMVFRIGSITKQFTAVATLMLIEQGKLKLDDEITKYLPDYPTQGHKVTIEHLLTHTSGIQSYTNLPEWRPLWRKDLTLNELFALTKAKPFEFAPGAGWKYNNTGYVMLGAIIEKASGQSYADFVEKNIFAPLGMKSSYYDNTQRLIPRRASGYAKNKDGYANAEYLSMSHPHAAGSLMSTVDDLAKWDAALYTDKLLKQESLRRAWTPYVLTTGQPTKYGYGWLILTVNGQPLITHGGGINGFTCDAVRLPEARVYVAILTNREGGVGNLAQRLAALASGKPLTDPKAVSLSTTALDKYVGVYEVSGQLNEKADAVVTREGDALFLQHPLFGKQQLLALSETEFFVKANNASRVTFRRRADGSVTGLRLNTGFAPDDEAKRTDKPLPQPKAPVAVDPASYDGYVGEYELAPNFIITITREGDKLMGQATGQRKFELQPEAPTKFVVPQVGAQIDFVAEGGKATSLILKQGGQTIPAKKIK